MSLDTELHKAYQAFVEYKQSSVEWWAFKEAVTPLMVEKREDIVTVNLRTKSCGHCGNSYCPVPNPKCDLCPTCFDLPIERKKDGKFGFVEKPEEPTLIRNVDVEILDKDTIRVNEIEYIVKSQCDHSWIRIKSPHIGSAICLNCGEKL